METLQNIGWVALFAFASSLVGIILILLASALLPKILDKFTPLIDEQKEILKGNQAVADYFGRIVSAAIIGVSLVVSAAVFVSMTIVFGG